MAMTSDEKDTVEVQDNNEQNLTSSNEQKPEESNEKVQDEEVREIINEDDVIEGLDIVDTWDEDEKDKPRRRSWDRSRGRDKRNSRDREKEKERDRDQDKENNRGRKRSRSEERKKESFRRDPNKSNKDIEQDKIRAKKDNDNKVLAEKEKAIKTLLDSNDVVPPGTEEEAIQNIVDKNQQQNEEEARKTRRNSRENRRRSPIRNRLGHRRFSPRRSPRRSPGRSPDRRRSPARSSDRRRGSLTPERRRRRSLDRENSAERREASRRRLRERYYGRRSRSRDRRSLDRHRSRSLDRHRRISRSPFDRHSPRRLHNSRRRSLSRSPVRSPNRSRRRSPFLNELARLSQSNSVRPNNSIPLMQQPMGPIHGMGPGGPAFIPPGGAPSDMHPGGPQQMDPRMIPGGPPGLLPTPGMMPVPGMQPAPPGLTSPMDMHQGSMSMHPGQVMHPRPQSISGPPGAGLFLNYDGCPPGPPGINFDSMNRGLPPPDYSSAPVIYTQGNPMGPIPHPMQPSSPQPVPAPSQPLGLSSSMMFPASTGLPMQLQPTMVPAPKYSPNASYNNRHSKSPNEEIFRNRNKHEERMKTPEPPIISDFKHNEKTSLSSLLEASVSTKDSSGLTTAFKGFKPEIIRKCERALRNLPMEDPRLKMKGRFFFDPNKKDSAIETKKTTSNSILLSKGRMEIYWDEEKDQLSAAQQQHQRWNIRKRVVTHQKICQTDETTRESVGTQVEPLMTDVCMQVNLQDLQLHPLKDDRRPLIDDRRPPLDNRRISLDDRRPSTDSRRLVPDDRRPPIDDRRPLPDDRRPPIDDRRPPHDDRRPPHDDRRPPHDDRRPSHDDRRPPHDERRPPHDERRPPHDERRPPIDDRRVPIDDRRPPIEDRRLPIEDRRPPIEDRRPPIDDRRPPIEDRRPPIDDRRPPIEDRRPPIDDRRPPIEDRRPPIDDRRPPLDDRRPLIEDRHLPHDDRRSAHEDRRMMDDRRPLADRLDWSMRETFDHSSKLRDAEDLRWTLSNNSVRDRSNVLPWLKNFSPKQSAIDHMHGGGENHSILGMDNLPRGGNGGIDIMRERGTGMDRGMDARDRMIDSRDRQIDSRERDMNMRDCEMDMRDPRGMDIIREREHMIDSRDGRGGIIDMGARGGMDEFPLRGREPMPLDDYDLRNNFSSGFNRNKELLERVGDRNDIGQRDSPVMMEDDSEELQIIEERGFDRDQPWQARNNNSFNNAKGGSNRNTVGNRPFRGRIGGYRSKF